MKRFSKIYQGDALGVLTSLDSDSVQCVITSPPYWGLRNYFVDGQIGLEPTLEEYMGKMLDVFREVRRVLKRDGVCWLNIGDIYNSYSGWGKRAAKGTNGTKNKRVSGLKRKDLIGIPWRIAFALQAEGWWLRSDVIWNKPNCIPESVRDRPTKSHEYIFLITKSARYFYNAEAVKEPAEVGDHPRTVNCRYRAPGQPEHKGLRSVGLNGGGKEMRNIRTVWSICPDVFIGEHFATFPKALVERCLLAGSREGDTVLDPFCGTGTTGLVALRHGRRFIGIDLSPKYIAMARERIKSDMPLFNEIDEVVFNGRK